jgi:hypothetical protein
VVAVQKQKSKAKSILSRSYRNPTLDLTPRVSGMADPSMYDDAVIFLGKLTNLSNGKIPNLYKQFHRAYNMT